MTWADEIEAQADGEAIEAVRFGNDLPHDPETDTWPEIRGRLTTWEEAKELLALGEGEDGYWTWPIIAWTVSWVIFTHDYDTMRDFRRVPRHANGEWDGEIIE